MHRSLSSRKTVVKVISRARLAAESKLPRPRAACNRSETTMLSIYGTAKHTTLRESLRAALGCPMSMGSWPQDSAKEIRGFRREPNR